MRRHIYIMLISGLILFISGVIHAQDITLRLPDTTSAQGKTIDIPVYVDNTLTGSNVLSYQLQVDYNPYYMQAVTVITTGTISAQMQSPNVNISESGRVTIAAAGTTAFTGLGKFIYIRFNLLKPGWSYLNFSDARHNLFNEGTPAVTLQNNGININARPIISITPNQEAIAIGDQLQMTVNGGTPPYQWFLTNTSIASIDANGLLSSLQAGLTKVVVQDNEGARDTTDGFISIRSIKLSVSDTLSQWPGVLINVPVMVTSMNGLNITSGSFTMNVDTNYLKPIGIIQTATLLAAYATPTTNILSDGTMKLSFAGTTALSGDGVLIYIQYRVSSRNNGTCALNFKDILFNQDILSGYHNGLFTIKSQAVIDVYPNSASVVVGKTKQFTVTGNGVTPYAWSVSDTAKASIDSYGLMMAKKSGVIRVWVTDSLGAKGHSDDILLYDSEVSVPEMKTCLASTILYYPILIDTIAIPEMVSSIEIKLAYDTTYLKFMDVVQSSTLTANWGVAKNVFGNQLNIALSNSTGFSNKGTLINLKFEMKTPFVLGSQAYVELKLLTMNEGSPSPMLHKFGFIRAENLTTPLITNVQDTLYSDANKGNQWYLFDGSVVTEITGAIAPNYVPKVNGTYFTIVSDTMGCVSDTSNKLAVSLTHVNTIAIKQVGVFPNPASDKIVIARADMDKNEGTIHIYDAAGLLVKASRLNQEQLILNIADLRCGIYIIEVISGEYISKHKLVIQR